MIKFAQFEKKQYLCMLFRGARMRKHMMCEAQEVKTER